MNDNRTKAEQIADEAAAEIKRQLDMGCTPDDLGYPGMTADELIASEWKAWHAEEMREQIAGPPRRSPCRT
jgi:hypothetical protein